MDKLPIEILDKILNYLNVKDRCTAVLVSKSFYNAGCTIRNIQDMNFEFSSYNPYRMICFSNALQWFATSDRIVNVTFSGLFLKRKNFIIHEKLYEDFSLLNRLKSLQIINIYNTPNNTKEFDIQYFTRVFQEFTHLQTLIILDRRYIEDFEISLNLHNKLEKNINNEELNLGFEIDFELALLSLKYLKISYYGDEETTCYLDFVLRHAPNLQEITIELLVQIENKKIFLDHIMDCIEFEAQKLIAITLTCNIDDDIIERMILFSELHLQRVDFSYATISNIGVINLVSRQKNIRKLNLDGCVYFDDYALAAIKKYLVSLEELYLNHTRVTCGLESNFYPRGKVITDAEAPQIKKMELSLCNITNSIIWMSSIKTSLTYIDLSQSAMDDNWFSVFPTWVPYLQELHLSKTKIASKGVWSILLNLKDLRILILRHCCKITGDTFVCKEIANNDYSCCLINHKPLLEAIIKLKKLDIRHNKQITKKKKVPTATIS